MEASKPSAETLAVTVYGSLIRPLPVPSGRRRPRVQRLYEGPGPGGTQYRWAIWSTTLRAVSTSTYRSTRRAAASPFLRQGSTRPGLPGAKRGTRRPAPDHFHRYAGKDASTLERLETAVVVPLGVRLAIGLRCTAGGAELVPSDAGRRYRPVTAGRCARRRPLLSPSP